MAGCGAKWPYILGAVLAGAVLLTVGLLLGHYAIPKDTPASEPPSWLQGLSKDLDESVLREFMNQLDATHIQENLR